MHKAVKILPVIVILILVIVAVNIVVPKWKVLSWAENEFNQQEYQGVWMQMQDVRKLSAVICDHPLAGHNITLGNKEVIIPGLKILDKSVLSAGSELVKFEPAGNLLISGPMIDIPSDETFPEAHKRKIGYQPLSETSYGKSTIKFVRAAMESHPDQLSLFKDSNYLIHTILLLTWKAGLVSREARYIVAYREDNKYPIYQILVGGNDEKTGFIQYINTNDERYQIAYHDVPDDIIECVIRQLSAEQVIERNQLRLIATATSNPECDMHIAAEQYKNTGELDLLVSIACNKDVNLYSWRKGHLYPLFGLAVLGEAVSDSNKELTIETVDKVLPKIPHPDDMEHASSYTYPEPLKLYISDETGRAAKECFSIQLIYDTSKMNVKGDLTLLNAVSNRLKVCPSA